MASTLWKELREDARRTYAGAPERFWHPLLGPVVHPGLRATLLYRIAHRLTRLASTRPFAALLERVSRAMTGCDLHPEARIGGGLHLPHPIGIVVGPTVEIAGPATLFQQVTIGARGGARTRGPRLAPYTFVYAGARILGDLEIGERTQIGPNCVIYRDLPAGSTVLPPEPRVLEGLSFSLRFSAGAPAVPEVAEP